MYCSTPISAQISVHSYPKGAGYPPWDVSGKYGSCFPRQCTEIDVHSVVNHIVEELSSGLMKVNDAGVTLCEKPVIYTTGSCLSLLSIIFIILFELLLSFSRNMY